MVQGVPGVLLSYTYPVSEWNQKNQRPTTQERNLRRRRKDWKEHLAAGFPGTRTHGEDSSGVGGTNTGSAEEVPRVGSTGEGALKAGSLGSGAHKEGA